MKKLYLSFFLTTYFVLLAASDDPACKIVIYRPANFYGAALSYKIMVNDSLVIRLRNLSFYEYDCNPGRYGIQVAGIDESRVSFEIKEGETRYVRFVLGTGFFSSLPDLILEESQSAKNNVDFDRMKELKYLGEVLPRPRNRLGIDFQVGIGITDIPMVTMVNGDEADISFGGGIGIGGYYGYEINRYFDLALDVNLLFSDLVPYVKNAEVTFRRLSAKITPSFIIPFDGGYSMRLKVGAGLGIYGSNLLNIDMDNLQGGFVDRWHYNTSIGPHARIVYEMNPAEAWTIAYGFSYYYVKYNFDYSKSSIFPDVGEFRYPNGSGFNLIIGLSYNF